MTEIQDEESAQRFRDLMARHPSEIEPEQLTAFYAALGGALASLGPLAPPDAREEGALCAAWFCRGQPAYMACVRVLVAHTRPVYMWDDHVRYMRACAACEN
jgi:hypothetical protein